MYILNILSGPIQGEGGRATITLDTLKTRSLDRILNLIVLLCCEDQNKDERIKENKYDGCMSIEMASESPLQHWPDQTFKQFDRNQNSLK